LKEKKEKYKQELNNQLIPKEINKNNPEEEIVVGALLCYILGSISSNFNVISDEMMYTNKQIIHLPNELGNNTRYLEDKITEDGEKTRELIISKALKITNEIIKCYSSIPPNFQRECAEKLWMIARHPEFINPLQALLEKGFIENNSYFYSWKYNDNKKKGYGINILAYYIYRNANLEKYAQSSKSTKDDSDNGIFTKRVWEPFNTAFKDEELKEKMLILENNIRNIDEPKNYKEFLKEINVDLSLGVTLK
jgi:hypothetical protein